MNSIYQKPLLTNVKKLLSDNQLPTEDLSEVKMEHFFGCGEIDNANGVIGLEKHGDDGLLRSLAVSEVARGLGCGSALVNRLEGYARSIGISQMYLLTETAEEYFKKRGYVKISREMASDAIQTTREFSELCPASATVMRKEISGKNSV